jgi:hypothetical protein
MSCVDKSILVEAEINRVLTQYRESPNLLFLIRTYLGQVADVIQGICNIPEYFDLDTAVGDQLTILGKRLGWPRCHCICVSQPVSGFQCEGVPSEQILAGFCDEGATWADCGPFGISEICLSDDELYRKFLKVRRYQMLNLYDNQSLTEALQTFWGPTAMVLDAQHGRVIIAPGRPLTDQEKAVLQLYPRVLPVAPGIQIRVHFGSTKVAGFGEGWGGFCDPWLPDGALLVTGDGTYLVTEDGVAISTGPLTRDAEWMCAVDVNPYDCAVT